MTDVPMTEKERYDRWVRTTDAYKLGRSDALEEARMLAETLFGPVAGVQFAAAISALKGGA